MKKISGILRIAIICMQMIWTGNLLAQSGRETLSGRVLEAGTNKPVRNASIYFDGTLNGATSDSTGSFTLYTQGRSKTPVVVSALGYNTETIADFPAGKKVVIYLGVKQYDLETVNITISDGMSRKQKLAIFRNEFLGTSANARSCEILNEDDIRISYTKKTKTIKAFSDKPVIVRNKNLGYTINFLPVNITVSPDRTVVQGYQFFEEDPAQSANLEIQKARQAVYLGSQIHFVRSLWNNELKKNGFDIYQGNVPAKFGNSRFLLQNAESHILTYDSIVNVINNDKYIHLGGRAVHIHYKGRTSFISAIDSVNDVIISNNGYSDPAGLIWGGVIGAQRVGDALPLEYNMGDQAVNTPESGIDSGIKDIVASADTLRSRMPAEKIYIQFDKPYYIVGDTVRMKAYLFDAALLKGSEKSGIIYVELANDTNKVFFRRMLPVGYGLGTGNIILNKEDIPEGSYTIRAYTNLMRNFGEDLVFRKNFYISGNSARDWLVSSQAVLSKQAGKDNYRLGLQLRHFNRKAVALQALDLRVLDGKKVIQRDKVQTDVQGKLDVNFNLPEKMEGNNLSLNLKNSKDEYQQISIPLPVNREENIDLQFMPEGGDLVAGVPSLVGFKAIGEDGRGVNVSGKIFNSSGSAEVAVFNSSFKGMGSFALTPAEGGSYSAKITLSDGSVKTFPLPAVKSKGSALRIVNSADDDFIILTVSNIASAGSNTLYYLTGQSRGIICYGAVIRFNGSNTNIRKIAKSLFPTGITRFTLMNADKQALNERITFIDHHDNLKIEIKSSQPAYQTRDSIALAIEVKDQEEQAIEGSFSLAVIDDSQVKIDSLSSNILTSLLLSSDLIGTVEDPAHYFLQTKQAQNDLDNLLLTQGWIGYDWKDVFNPPVQQFSAESQFNVHGTVTNVFNKPVASTGINLFSIKQNLAMSAVTAEDGSFTFSGFPLVDSLKFFIQTKNPKGKRFNVGIQVDEFKPAEFKAQARHDLPWYVNSDTVLLEQATTRAVQEAKLNGKGINLLQEVTIKAKKIVNNSKNLNGPGEADQVFDEKDISSTPKKTLLNLMEEKVRGFNVGLWPSANNQAVGINNISSIPIPTVSGPGGMGTESRTILGTAPYMFEKTNSYKIFDKEIHLVIDGVDVESLYFPVYGYPFPTNNAQLALQRKVEPGGNYILERNAASPDDRLRFIKQYLDNILAEDVKGIEVMSDPKYTGRYKTTYSSKATQSLSVVGADFAYVEVTTYSGNGAFIKTETGTYLYRPIPYVNLAAFYKPKYAVKSSPLSDLRSTIHWEPNVITDKEGKAAVSFYSADRPGTYSIIIEGSDMSGNVGRKTGVITIR